MSNIVATLLEIIAVIVLILDALGFHQAGKATMLPVGLACAAAAGLAFFLKLP